MITRSKRVEQIILDHVFKIKSSLSPGYMLEHFIPASSVHAYRTRFRDWMFYYSKGKRDWKEIVCL